MNYKEKKQSDTKLINVFKNAIESYCSLIDNLEISNIFYPYDYYTKEELGIIYFHEENREIIELAKNNFYDYYRQDYIFSNKNIKNNSGLPELEKYIWNENYYTSKTSMYYILKLSFIISFYQRLRNRYENKEITITDYSDLEKKELYSFYYRGQTNYEYRISPSIIRNFNNSVFLDDDYYYKLLLDEGLENKFNKYVKRNSINKYEKYAFIQHSCSFSPFIDFTESVIAAASFALSNSGNVNCFRNEDSAIFCVKNEESELETIEDKNDAREFLINDFNLKIINSKYFEFGHEYKLNKADGTQFSIKYYSIKEFVDNLTPKIKILNIPTNDRMIYQKGLFICFYGCICLKDFIAYELNPYFSFIKVKIPKRFKRAILNNIYKNKRELDPEHLMNPYLIFKE